VNHDSKCLQRGQSGIISIESHRADTDAGHDGYWTTRGYANSRIVNSRTGQLADATVDFACLVFVLLAACETASCPVRDLSSPRVGNPRVGVSASCPVTRRTHKQSTDCVTRPLKRSVVIARALAANKVHTNRRSRAIPAATSAAACSLRRSRPSQFTGRDAASAMMRPCMTAAAAGL